MASRDSGRTGFADIHSHVLYGMDDGAKTRADSVRMLEYAALSGTTDIVATPHANRRFTYDPAIVDAQIADLNASVKGIRVHRGCDFFLQVDNIQDAVANPQKYTINGHGYLMVEFPEVLFHDADTVLTHLLESGFIPIITHPERHALIRRRIATLARWVDLGCYVQVTAGSITGRFGKAARAYTETLLERGLLHVVASDAHDCVHRPPTMLDAYERLSRAYGAAAVDPMFFGNPRTVINGGTLDVAGVPLHRSRKWYQFWR